MTQKLLYIFLVQKTIFILLFKVIAENIINVVDLANLLILIIIIYMPKLVFL